MPWTASSFAAKHDKKLRGKPGAAKAARVANGMLRSGVPEGEAIATGIARAKGQKPKRHARNPFK